MATIITSGTNRINTGKVTNGIMVAVSQPSKTVLRGQQHQVTTPRATLTLVGITRVAVQVASMLPRLALLFQTLTRCLGTACTAIHVGTMTNYGLLWVIYIKVACGLRRSPCCKPSIITTPRNLPTVQPTYVQRTITTTTTTTPAVVSTTPAFLPLPMQVIISTYPPWVTTPLVSCTPLAATATIGRQVLSHGAAPTRTSCSSTVVTSACSTTTAAPGSGSTGLSSPCDCPLLVSPSKKRSLIRKNRTK